MSEHKPNRTTSKQPKRRGSWCDCDRAFVFEGQRCPVCNKRFKKRFKRPIPLCELGENHATRKQ